MPFLLESTRNEVRDRILDAALKLFVKNGYAATSTRHIAAACDMTAGALYTHFRGKAQLFAAVVDRYRARLTVDENPVRELLEQSRFPDDLPELAHAVGKLVRRHREYWLLWYVDVIEFEGAHFQSALAPSALLAVPGLERRLATLAKKRALRVEPRVAFVMVYMHLFNFFLIEQIFRGKSHYGVSEKEAIAAITEVFRHGMLA